MVFNFFLQSDMKGCYIILFIFIFPLFNSCKSTSAEEYLYNGLKKLQNNDLKGALELFDKAIVKKPDYAEAYLQRGRTKFNLNDYNGAIEDFTNAIKYDNLLAAAYYNRASVYKYKGEQDSACEDIKKAKELKYPNIDDSFRRCNNEK